MLSVKENKRLLPKNAVYASGDSQVKPINNTATIINKIKKLDRLQVDVDPQLDMEPSLMPLSNEIKSVENVKEIKGSSENGKPADISFKKIEKNQNTVIQEGFQSRKLYETRVITTPFDKNGNYIMPKHMEEKNDFIEPFPSDTVNKYKHQWKSGMQVQADVNRLTGREKLELKEVIMPEDIYQRGFWSNIAYQNSNGLNGYQKISLIKKTGGREVAFD